MITVKTLRKRDISKKPVEVHIKMYMGVKD